MERILKSRNELLDQWRAIEQEQEQEDDDHHNCHDSSRLNRIQQAKENWFSSAYNFLICLPSSHHPWCGYWDIMGPFLETFFNYYKVESDDSLLKMLWGRVSQEMRRCTECISRHHQAQEMYKAEYESGFISPLLSILQRLDEERVSEHIKEANSRLAQGGYHLDHDNAEIVSLMFEVLTFPILLGDEFIVNEFQKLIEAVDDAHELALAKQQHFPGVYALLFFKSRKSRSIGHRLAGNLGKLRSAAELEPLQPFLKRCIGFLTGDEMQPTSENSRPRVHMDHITIWLGLKALYSLESLHDGEFEKQRRHFLYFLLHQVTRSSNFSMLMRKKACQISFLIVHRGYKMNPPSPPFECAHMWGPSLVSSLKDLTLHSSLRQPAIDLVQTIIVSDATALLSSLLHCQTSTDDSSNFFELSEEIDDATSCFVLDDKKRVCCWNEFTFQSNIVCQEYTEWMCAPMLWFDVLLDIEPSILPVSIAKAVLWALSRFSMVEPENNSELSLPVKTWLSSGAAEVAAFLGWKCPSGSDDSGDGKNVRQVGRRILEYVSDTRGLASGLQFLCCSGSSLTAILQGLKHALKLVQLDSVLVNFQSLHHFFFVLCKIFKEGFSPAAHPAGNSSDELSLKFASQGGFLQQLNLNSLQVNDGKQLSKVDKKLWESFSSELAEVAWPSVKKCLHKGKAFMDYRISQMSCVRLLEILPILFRELTQSSKVFLGKNSRKMNGLSDMSWLHDLVDWGKSELEAVIRYWKLSMTSLPALLKSLCNERSEATVKVIEKLIASDVVPMDSLKEQVSRLSVSLSNKVSYIDKCIPKSKSLSDGLAAGKKSSSFNIESSVQILDTVATRSRNSDPVILLSDDETEILEPPVVVRDAIKPIKGDVLAPSADKSVMQSNIEKSYSESGSARILSEVVEERAPKDVVLAPKSRKPAVTKHALTSTSLFKIKDKQIGETDVSKSILKEGITLDKATARSFPAETAKNNHLANAQKKAVSGSNDTILKEIVRDTEDPLESALKSAGRNHSSLKMQSSSFPKRKVIQLADPIDSRSVYLRKMEAAARRLKPPKMDEWFRAILEMDYFAAVGLDTDHQEKNETPLDLKEVPVCFESPQQYVDIFRPLILEEFKAQLRSSFQEVSLLEEMSCGSLSVVSVERVDEFHLVRCVHDELGSSASSSCAENDLVLLTKQPIKNSPHNVYLVGKVERREKDNKRRLNMLLIRFYVLSGCSRLNRARKQLLERSKWYLSRIMSITPQLREFQALSSIEVIPALPIILKPADHSHASTQNRKVDLSKLSRPMQQVLKSTFNGSQIQAINAVLEIPDSKNDFDLSLVQGPPGTGKTRTIVALISALLAVSLQSKTIDKQYGNNLKHNSTPFTNFRKSISESAAIARAWQDAALARQLNDNAGNDVKMPRSSGRKRVLVCAQSNAAVDELVSRLAGEGLYGADGNMYKPYLVRVGNAKTIHPNSLPFFIDTLVEHRLAEEKMAVGDGKDELIVESSTTLRESLEKTVDRIKFYESKRANLKDESTDKDGASDEHLEADIGKKMLNSELEARLRSLYNQKKEIYIRLAAIQAREKKTSEEIRVLRNKLRRSILREAEIVVTTLSGCGGDLYSACFESMSNSKIANLSEHNLFDAVVIDEAAQALEPATLIPLQLLKSSGTKCIMVGDPKQLPATVLSNVASRYLYECSMFERLQRAGYPVIMLTEQYRMHPEISRFPSLHFYDGKLLDGVLSSSKAAPFHKTPGLGPYVFYNVSDGQESYGRNAGSSSLYNEGEADAAIEIVKFFQKRYSSEFIGERIGIITPYKSQLSLLRSRFSSVFGSSVSSEMEFNTIDGFQGREVDILILSTVRSSDTYSTASKMNSSSIGFVADIRRMNVALTRARLSLWILGNERTLKKNRDWAALMKDARERNLIISVKRPYKSICENILGTTTNTICSDDYCGKLSEEVKKSQHGLQIGSNHDNFRRKSKNKDMKHKRDKSSASEGLETARTKEDTTEKCKKQAEQQDIHQSKYTRGVHQLEHENSGLKKISDTLGSKGVENPVRHSKNQDPARHSKKQDPVGNSKNQEFVVRHSKHQEDKGGLRSHVNSKVQSKGVDEDGRPAEIERPKDMISNRKQQREAVDALLSSALLPSKKPETSARTVAHKRPRSPSSTGGVSKSTKQQRGTNVFQ
uniref:Uncharacterized protein n=1 Tax=Chenopodium quinoa TaxID=63459 RepID=A0A803KQM3_CHEQI